MFDELIAQDVWRLTLVVVAGSEALGLLARSHIRSLLIWTWALVPLTVAITALCSTKSGQLGSSLSFVGLFSLASLLMWVTPALLAYNFLRRMRELSSGANHRNGN